MNVYLDSVGCRLNQSEIESYARHFRAAGHHLVECADQADLVVINTCTVTAEAASDSRQKIRQVSRAGASQIAVTGCWATLNVEAALAMPGVSHALTLSGLTLSGNGGKGIFTFATGTLAVTDSTFTGNTEYDVADHAVHGGSVTGCSLESVYFANGSSTVSLSGNTFTNWGARTSRVTPNQSMRLTLDNALTKVAGARYEITGGRATRDGTWAAAGGDPTLAGTVTVEGTDGADGVTALTIEPGMVVRSGYGTQLVIGSGAPRALVADGDTGPGAPSPILFTTASATPAPGQWSGLVFGAQTSATVPSIVRNAAVEYAGYYFGGTSMGAINLRHAAGVMVTLERVTLRRSNYVGLDVGGAAGVATPVGNQTYDGNGNVTVSGSANYVYDVENQLVEYTASAKTAFTYDGLGRLRKRIEYVGRAVRGIPMKRSTTFTTGCA